MSIDQLNQQFAKPAGISFGSGPQDIPVVMLKTRHASATVSLYGAQVLSYKPHDGPDLIWLSDQANYQPGAAIRGGIPVCWPWFGPHPEDPALPAHGLARTSLWAVQATSVDGHQEAVQITLTWNTQNHPLWPHHAKVSLRIRLAGSLDLQLITHNLDRQTLDFSMALHSYFRIKDVQQVQIEGLAQTEYLDKLDKLNRHKQTDPLVIRGETDRIYLDTEATCQIKDPGLGRRIGVAKTGSASTIVWNPWIEKARAMSDMREEDYREMLCVESGNVAQNSLRLAPDQTHEMTVSIQALNDE